MKLLCERDALKDALAGVIGRTKNGKNIPILGHVLLDASKGTLRLTGNDLGACSIVEMPCEVSSPGAFTLPCDRLAKLVAGLPAGGQITIDADERVAKVKAGRSSYSFHGLPASDFPDAFKVEEYTEMVLSAKQAQRLFKTPAPCISTESSRPHLNGIFLHHQSGKILSVATDGHTLIRTSVEVDVPQFIGVIIPEDACSEIVKLAGESEVAIRVSARLIEAVVPRRRFISKLIDATFPDYAPVIPQSNPVPFSVEVADVEAAIARLSSAGESSSPSVKFSWDDDVECLRLQRRGDGGEGAEEIGCICDGRPAGEIGFNGDYVRRILDASAGARVRLYFDGVNSPARVVNPDDPDFVSVIMPMRV